MIRIRKKFFCQAVVLLLFTCFCIVLLPIQVQADSAHALTAPNVDSLPGNIVEVPVYLTSPGDVAGLQFDLGFDSGLLTYQGISAGSHLTTGFSPLSNVIDGNKVRVIIYHPANQTLPSGTGEIAVLTFQVVGSNDCQLTFNGVKLANDAAVKISPVTLNDGSVTVKANFVKTWNITVTAGEGGSVSGGGTYENGEEVTATATANGGYRFDKWTEDGVAVPDAGASYTFTAAGDRTLVASFKIISPGGGGGGGSSPPPSAPPSTPPSAPVIAPPPSGDPMDKHQSTFADTESHWAEGPINRLSSMGLISGYPDNTFKPNNSISRIETIAILTKLLNLAPATPEEIEEFKATFADAADVPDWGLGYAVAVFRSGLVKGYMHPDGSRTFNSGNNITRSELALLIAQILVKELGAITPAELTFSDADDIPEWAAEGIRTAVAKGIISGYPDNTFRPQDNITRGEAVAMIERLYNALR